MKRIFSYLFAILFAVGTTGVFTSCQEDAVEIDYTISVTVNNDLTEVINAINNGTFADPSEAIQSLVDAINKLSGDQETKFKALQDAINGLATTLDAKIAVLEAAMKAQTVTLEGKIGLLEAAIKALPDYTEKLGALEAAIKALPDYSTKLAAIETAIKNIPDYSEKLAAIEDAIKNAPDYTAALEEIKSAIAALPDYSEQLGAIITAIAALPDYSEQLGLIQAAVEAIPDYTEKLTAIQTALEAIKQQNSDNATDIAALQASIDDIAKAVEEGNKNQEDALAEILALLETIDRTIKTEYVTFTADAAQTLSYEGSDLQYSTDGTTFLALPANTPIEFGGNTKLYLRGVNNLDGTKDNGISFTEDIPVACTGDIRTLIDYATYKTVDTSNATFTSLFQYCTVLTSAPALPATILADDCYKYMFYACNSLKEAPALPATTLADGCYEQMFCYCTSLVNAPELPATTLVLSCYRWMFNGCTSLNVITMLATDISADFCLDEWVDGVAATGTFTKNASATYDPSTIGIPAGWTVVNQ